MIKKTVVLYSNSSIFTLRRYASAVGLYSMIVPLALGNKLASYQNG